MGTKVLVVTDNNPILGATLAEELGRMVVAARGNATEPHPALDSALATALAYPEGPIVIADTADNAGAGAGSDSTFLLEALIRRGIGNTVIGPLWDPVSVRFCLEAGVGATIALRIGGKVGPASGQPIDATVRIEAIKRDATMVFAGLPTSMGDAALVAIGVAGQEPIRIVLNTIRTQAYGVELFTQFGLDLSRQRLIIVKSMQHFYAAFAPIAKAVVYMGSPGTASQDFKSLTYKSITRPMWPFDAT
jgi:microcystin degradation protein MlrC